MALDNDFSRVPAEEPETPGQHHARIPILDVALARAATADADGDVEIADPLGHWHEVTP